MKKIYYVAQVAKNKYLQTSLSKSKAKAEFCLANWERQQAFNNLKPIAIEPYSNLADYVNKIVGEVIPISQDKYKQLKQKDVFNNIFAD